jgi:putative membrane protein
VHVDVVVGVGLLAGAYLGGYIARGVRVSRRHAARFFGGLLGILVALNGPLHELSDTYLFSAHMVQHLVLTLVVPPLLLIGTPGFMLDALLGPLLSWRLTRGLVRAATRPLPAFAAYGVAMVAWHLPALYTAALEIHAVHIVQHLVLLATSTLAWWPILSASRRAPALPYAGQILYLFVFGMPMTIVAAMVTGADHVLYPFYAAAPRLWDLSPLADQRLGGVIMWVPAGLIPLAAFTIVFFRWAAAEAEEAA